MSGTAFNHIEDVRDFLTREGYFSDLSLQIELYNLFNYHNRGIPSLIISGPTGCGKTFLMEILIKEFGGRYYQCISETSSKHIVAETDIQQIMLKNPENAIRKGILAETMEKSGNGLQIVCIDEIDKAPGHKIDVLLLQLLQSGSISGTLLGDLEAAKPENMIVIIGKNYEREITEPLMRRSAHIELGHPSARVMESAGHSARVPEIDENMLNWLILLYQYQLANVDEFTKLMTIQELQIVLENDYNIGKGFRTELDSQEMLMIRCTRAIRGLAKYAEDFQTMSKVAAATPYSSSIVVDVTRPVEEAGSSVKDFTAIVKSAIRSLVDTKIESISNKVKKLELIVSSITGSNTARDLDQEVDDLKAEIVTISDLVGEQEDIIEDLKDKIKSTGINQEIDAKFDRVYRSIDGLSKDLTTAIKLFNDCMNGMNDE
ncbi:MAG: AAA family ATPase [bacterium]|nr:AAA family ATPase [bacterium]